MNPAVAFLVSLGAGVAGAAALMRPGEVRPGVWRLEGAVAAACVGLGAGLAATWLPGLAGGALLAALAAAGLAGAPPGAPGRGARARPPAGGP